MELPKELNVSETTSLRGYHLPRADVSSDLEESEFIIGPDFYKHRTVLYCDDCLMLMAFIYINGIGTVNAKVWLYEWTGGPGDAESIWDVGNKGDCIMSCDVIFEGVRHLFFHEDGYLNYPALESISKSLAILNNFADAVARECDIRFDWSECVTEQLDESDLKAMWCIG